VFEYRTMVSGLHADGLRVIQDVVFNHTSASGETFEANLDEIVPNYYHRLDSNGALLTGSCCADTASEHRMMEKLTIDTLVLNAKEYKIDGFRFDEMSLHFVYNMTDIQAALHALTPKKDGVDGSKIYLYGEGFQIGETANNALGPNASQLNLYGTGVGSFNDRMRDGIRGGSPFTDERTQGFATGLATDPSEFTNSSTSQSSQIATLLQEADWIRISLTGNLRNYTFIDAEGQSVTGGDVNYGGQPAGYAATPIEDVDYCSVHDNQTLFDAIQLKAAASDNITTRARRQVVADSLIALGQGIPFFLGGDDLLRSKDMDNNSYISGTGSIRSTSVTGPITGESVCPSPAKINPNGRSCSRCSPTPHWMRLRRIFSIPRGPSRNSWPSVPALRSSACGLSQKCRRTSAS
jgi:pullulanase